VNTGVVLRWQSGWGVKLITRIHLKPRLRSREAGLYAYAAYVPSWCGRGQLYSVKPLPLPSIFLAARLSTVGKPNGVVEWMELLLYIQKDKGSTFVLNVASPVRFLVVFGS
jgi:hypothetical protein